jgi:hypothetical protein
VVSTVVVWQSPRKVVNYAAQAGMLNIHINYAHDKDRVVRS